VIPSPVWRRCRPCRLSSRVEHPKGLWWDQMRAASELAGITKQSKRATDLAL
jgi:hypothetical protein